MRNCHASESDKARERWLANNSHRRKRVHVLCFWYSTLHAFLYIEDMQHIVKISLRHYNTSWVTHAHQKCPAFDLWGIAWAQGKSNTRTQVQLVVFAQKNRQCQCTSAGIAGISDVRKEFQNACIYTNVIKKHLHWDCYVAPAIYNCTWVVCQCWVTLELEIVLKNMQGMTQAEGTELSLGTRLRPPSLRLWMPISECVKIKYILEILGIKYHVHM